MGVSDQPMTEYEIKKAGLPPAVFESRRGIFKVTLYNFQTQKKQDVIGKIETSIPKKIIDFCHAPRLREEIEMHLGSGNNYEEIRHLNIIDLLY